MKWRRIFPLVALLVLGACAGTAPSPTAPPAALSTTLPGPTPARPEILLATTTSTQDSGLLDVLLPDFQQRTGYHVKPIAVGSGQALTMGQQGNADVLLVHSPDAEAAFMQTGAGVDRRLIMHNDFVIIGPAADPAQVRGRAAVPALQAIAARGATWVSRDDKSGTNALELKLWQGPGSQPAPGRLVRQHRPGHGRDPQHHQRTPGVYAQRPCHLPGLQRQDHAPDPGRKGSPAAQHLPRHPGEPGQMAPGECRRRAGVRRLPGIPGRPAVDRQLRPGEISPGAVCAGRRQE